MSRISSTERLKKDLIRMKKDPIPYIVAEPDPNNILEWHYLMRGPEDSVYAGGYYHGMLIFPNEFPFKPPGIMLLTPNGRFKPDTKICFSNSDYHPESWNPIYNSSTILIGFLSFMLDGESTYGVIQTTEAEKKNFAKESGAFNLKSKIFCELFPDVVQEIESKLAGN